MELDFVYYIATVKGNFFGYVMGQHGNNVFEIRNNEEMRELIKNGTMLHVDDVEGLQKYLKNKRIIPLYAELSLGVFQ